MYDVAELGGLSSSEIKYSNGWKINEAGQVAGFSYTDLPNLRFQAFLWTPATPAPTINWAVDGNNQVGDLNNLGQVVGWSWQESDSFRVGALWNPPNFAPARFDVPGVDRQALGVNDAGQVVGWYEASDQGIHVAFIWDPRNGFRDLPSLVDGTSSQAHAIGRYGRIVGRSGAPVGLPELGSAVLWRPQPDGSFSVERLDSPADWISVAVAIDEHGRMAGWGYPSNGNTDQGHALYWPGSSPHLHVSDLGTLGHQMSVAQDINNQIQIVGYVADALAANHRAFLWTGGLLVDLNDQIPPDSGWLLEEANGINDAGVIVGVGVYQGQQRAVQLTPRVVTHHDTLADELRRFVVAELAYILYGLRAGEGGAVIQPGGRPIPVPPNPTWETLSASTKDLLVGLVTSQVAQLVQDPAGRRELQRAALNVVRREVERQLGALEG